MKKLKAKISNLDKEFNNYNSYGNFFGDDVANI